MSRGITGLIWAAAIAAVATIVRVLIYKAVG